MYIYIYIYIYNVFIYLCIYYTNLLSKLVPKSAHDSRPDLTSNKLQTEASRDINTKPPTECGIKSISGNLLSPCDCAWSSSGNYLIKFVEFRSKAAAVFPLSEAGIQFRLIFLEVSLWVHVQTRSDGRLRMSKQLWQNMQENHDGTFSGFLRVSM